MSILRDLIVSLVGIIAFVYLLNPTAGFVELIPDNIPILGNLDEAGATALVLYSLRYFGVDILNLINDIMMNQPRRGR